MSSHEVGVLPADVLDYIERNQPCTKTQIAQELGTTTSAIRRCVKVLRQDNTVGLQWGSDGYRIIGKVQSVKDALFVRKYEAMLLGTVRAAANSAMANKSQVAQAGRLIARNFTPKEIASAKRAMAEWQTFLSYAQAQLTYGDNGDDS